MIHWEEVTYLHSLDSFGFWLLGWSSCWTDAKVEFYYLERLICAEQACSFWAASQGSRSLLCNSNSVWWTDEGPLAVVISLEWSGNCHWKLWIVVIFSTHPWKSSQSLHASCCNSSVRVTDLQPWMSDHLEWVFTFPVPVQAWSVAYQLVLMFIILICRRHQKLSSSPAIVIKA